MTASHRNNPPPAAPLPPATRGFSLKRDKPLLLLLGLAFSLIVGTANLFFQDPKQVSVQQSINATGDLVVDGFVEGPPMSPNQNAQTLTHEGTPLAHFTLRDQTAIVEIYFDPATLPTPVVGSSVRVHGRHVRTSDGNMRTFLAERLGPIPER